MHQRGPAQMVTDNANAGVVDFSSKHGANRQIADFGI